jgi:predicted acetyltransferase
VTTRAISLHPISRDEAPTLRNLFELYAYDFSELVPLELHANGRFDVPVPDRWWDDADHFPFFIREDERLCGFALARRGSRITGATDVMDVAEFFVIRGARGNGVGAAAARALFAAFPGRWEIRVRQTNTLAKRFWERVAHEWAGRPIASEAFTAENVAWDVFRLSSEGAGAAGAIPGGLRRPVRS